MPATKTCQTCEGTGWVLVREEEAEKVSACPDCRSQARSNQRFQNAAIPPRYGEQGFETFSTPHRLQKKALLRSIEFVEAFPELERGLLFVGPCGVGKTHLSVAILNAVLSGHDSSARFVDEAELLRSLQHSYGRDSQSSEEELLRPLRRVDLLVWDDLGTGRPTDWVRETIHTATRISASRSSPVTGSFPRNQASRVCPENRLSRIASESDSIRAFSKCARSWR